MLEGSYRAQPSPCRGAGCSPGPALLSRTDAPQPPPPAMLRGPWARGMPPRLAGLKFLEAEKGNNEAGVAQVNAFAATPVFF